MTQADTESQNIILNILYPRRTFQARGVYRLQDALLDGNIVLLWDVRGENKTAELKGKWENPAMEGGNLHDMYLALSHPSFRKVIFLFYFTSISFNVLSFIWVYR